MKPSSDQSKEERVVDLRADLRFKRGGAREREGPAL